MSKTLRTLTAAALLLICVVAQPAWGAGRWITHPEARGSQATKAITLQFRRELELRDIPDRWVVRVSADNRFVLFVNGKRVAEGPARGDLSHWRYRPVDLVPHLRKGKNVLAALVWNDGAAAPLAQISARTGFFVAAVEGHPESADSGPGWRVRIDGSRTVESGVRQIAEALGPSKYYAAAPAETHHAAHRRGATALDWVAAADAVSPREPAPWTLVEDRLPPMRYDRVAAGKLVRAEGVTAAHFPINVPPESTATLLIDAGKVQAAYPALTVSGGRGAEITLTYSEALYGSGRNYLRNRRQVAGGKALGLTDTFRPDGTRGIVFQPFWWRTWRFAELRVKTGAEPLRLQSFLRYATGYPFAVRGRFKSDDPELDRIWSIGWDTVQLDAHETFMDTAYWEQLQYIGDTRIEALVSYAVSGDPRLAVQAIEAFDRSRTEGIPQSRWPSREAQSIPPFALLWIGMLHDYWRYRPDHAPVARSLPGARSVLDWYRRHVRGDGLVGTTPGWEFIDWRATLSNSPWEKEPPKSDPCVITLLYIGALRQAADLEAAVGEAGRAEGNKMAARQASQAVNARCWSAARGLYADAPEKTAFSQHANALAVLYDVAPKAGQAGILNRITVRGGGIAAPNGVTGTTYYFAFYLARALNHAGLGNRYVELLRTWRGLLAQNFTTWPEEPDPSRSDSHAWSAHPTADLLAIVAGIQPASPGFRSVRIAPHLGNLRRLDAALAHPFGLVEVRYRRVSGKLRAVLRLPPALSGEFAWGSQRLPLRPGNNSLVVPYRESGHDVAWDD